MYLHSQAENSLSMKYIIKAHRIQYLRKQVPQYCFRITSLQWRHNGRDGVSYHQPRDCLLNRIFRSSSKKASKLRVTALCAGNSPVTSEVPAQRVSNAENVSIWWCYHVAKCVFIMARTSLNNKPWFVSIKYCLAKYFGSRRCQEMYLYLHNGV